MINLGDVTHETGEYAFSLRGAGGEHRIRFWGDIPTPTEPRYEPALAAALLPAMAAGEQIEIEGPVSLQLLRVLPELQGALTSATASNSLVESELRTVDVVCRDGIGGGRSPAPTPASGVAAFFSGGLDSWSILLADPTITELLYVHGFDVSIDSPEVSSMVESRLAEAAKEVGKPLRVIRTDLRRTVDPFLGWEIAHGPALAAAAQLLAPTCGRVLIGSSAPYSAPAPRGSSPVHDYLWSTEDCRIEHRGAHMTRPDKLEQVAGYQPALDVLRVCWHDVDQYNCGRCEKCLLTMASLEAIGALDRCPTFSVPLDHDAVAGMRFDDPELVNRAQEILDTARSNRANARLIEALEACVAANTPDAGPSWKEVEAARARVAGADQLIADLRNEIDLMRSSHSWRLTQPLRQAGSALRHRQTRKSPLP